MALANFYEILVFIIGTPANDTEEFMVYSLSVLFGAYFLFFIFDMLNLIKGFLTPKNNR